MNTAKTAEQIAEIVRDKDGVANIRAINNLYRQQDESHLWPVSGRFNVTERAIKRLKGFRQTNMAIYGLEYCYCLEGIMQGIVNREGGY